MFVSTDPIRVNYFGKLESFHGCINKIDLDQNGSSCIWYLHLLPPEIILKIMLAYLGNPYDLTLSPPKLKSLNRLCP